MTTDREAVTAERQRLAEHLRAVADGYEDDRAGFVRVDNEEGARFAIGMRDTLRGMAAQLERDGTLLGNDGATP